MTELLTAKPQTQEECWRMVIFDSFGNIYRASTPLTWLGLLVQVRKWSAGQRIAMFPSYTAKVFCYRDGVWRSE